MTPQIPPEKIPRIIEQNNEENRPATDTLQIERDRVTGYAGSRTYQTTDGMRQAIATVSTYNHGDNQAVYIARAWAENSDGEIITELHGHEFENPIDAIEDARQIVQDMADDGYT